MNIAMPLFAALVLTGAVLVVRTVRKGFDRGAATALEARNPGRPDRRR